MRPDFPGPLQHGSPKEVMNQHRSKEAIDKLIAATDHHQSSDHQHAKECHNRQGGLPARESSGTRCDDVDSFINNQAVCGTHIHLTSVRKEEIIEVDIRGPHFPVRRRRSWGRSVRRNSTILPFPCGNESDAVLPLVHNRLSRVIGRVQSS